VPTAFASAICGESGKGAVHAPEGDEQAAFVYYSDCDLPVVSDRVVMGGSNQDVGLGETQRHRGTRRVMCIVETTLQIAGS